MATSYNQDRNERQQEWNGMPDAQDPKPFKIYVRWGDGGTQRETCESPRDACEYEFATEAELDAFMLAISEHDGWLECDTFTAEELAAEPEAWED